MVPQRAPWRRKLLVLVALAATLVVGGLYYWFGYLGTPLWDEWHCKKGQAPVQADDGASYCAAPGQALQPGERWDPLGNRPFVCDGRRGWTVIYRDGDEDCLRDGRDMPHGWSTSPTGG